MLDGRSEKKCDRINGRGCMEGTCGGRRLIWGKEILLWS